MPDALQLPPIPPLMPTFDGPPPTEEQLRWKLAGGWGMVLVAIFILLFSLGLALGLAVNLSLDHDYRTEGKPAEGVVTSMRTSSGRKSTTYYVEYRFADHQSVSRSKEESVPSDYYKQTRVGQRVPLEFLPSDSTYSRIVRERGSGGEWVMGVMAALLFPMSLLMFFGNRKSARRRAAVIFRGQAVPGQIVTSEAQGAGKSRKHVLAYRYMDLAGQEKVSKECSVTMRKMEQFPRGTLIAVLIDPADPARPEPDLYGVRPIG